MPSRNEIFEEIDKTKKSAADKIRRKYLKDLSAYTGRDTIIFSSAFSTIPNLHLPLFVTSIDDNDVHGFMSAFQGLIGNELDLILHSPGGSLEATIQIVKYLRNKYFHIRAIIPQKAMSTATMIACACDSIIMGRHSAIGPIDPQIFVPGPFGGLLASAWSILDEFERAKIEMERNPASAPLWVHRIGKYPPGFLSQCENTVELAKEMVGNWLTAWMLKKKDSKKIVNWLGDAKIHKTHKRPIDIDEASSHGIVVEALENDKILQDKVLSVFHATMATHLHTSCVKFVENHNGIGNYLVLKVPPHPVPPAKPVKPMKPQKTKRTSRVKKTK